MWTAIDAMAQPAYIENLGEALEEQILSATPNQVALYAAALELSRSLRPARRSSF